LSHLLLLPSPPPSAATAEHGCAEEQQHCLNSTAFNFACVQTWRTFCRRSRRRKHSGGAGCAGRLCGCDVLVPATHVPGCLPCLLLLAPAAAHSRLLLNLPAGIWTLTATGASARAKYGTASSRFTRRAPEGADLAGLMHLEHVSVWEQPTHCMLGRTRRDAKSGLPGP